MDPYLSAIIRAAEDGGEPVHLSIALNSGALLTGYVRNARYFVDMTREELSTARLATTPMKKRNAETYDEAKAYALERVDSIRKVDGSEGARAITLSDVTIAWSNGDGIKVATLRLNLDSVSAWWCAPGSPFRGPQDASGFFGAGVAVPIG